MNKLKKHFMITTCLLLIMLNGNNAFSNSTIPVFIKEPAHNPNLEDRFLEGIKAIEAPAYTLDDDFPKDQVKTFKNFLIFCASVESVEKKTLLFTERPGMYQLPLVKARLELNNPVRYEDFLAAVPLSISIVSYIDQTEWFEFVMQLNYLHMFLYPSRNSFFVKNILEPLSHDLKTGDYRGYHFKDENLPQLFQELANYIYDRRMDIYKNLNDDLLDYYSTFAERNRP